MLYIAHGKADRDATAALGAKEPVQNGGCMQAVEEAPPGKTEGRDVPLAREEQKQLEFLHAPLAQKKPRPGSCCNP